MRKVRENIIVASGDQSIFAADQKIFSSAGANVAKGQIAFWDPVSGKSIGPGSTAATYDRFVISAGIGGGKIRSSFGDVIYANNIQAVTAEPPACGVPEIWDLFFEGVDCDEEFAVNITVEDDFTQNEYPYNKRAVFSYSVKTEDCSCNTCDSGIDDLKLACLLRDAINGDSWNRQPKDKRSVFNNLDLGQGKRFQAHILYGGGTEDTTNFIYCINPTDDSCDNCINTGSAFDVKKIIFDGGEVEIDINAGVNGHLVENLNAIVTAINDALGDNGSAAVTKGAGAKDASGACCPWRLEINTCHTDFALRDAQDNPIATCASGNPFDAVEIANTCTNCGAGDTKTYAAGIRIIADPVVYSCDDKYEPNPPIGSFTRKLNIHAHKGFECANASFVRKLQGGAVPDNFGYLWQWREAAADVGGVGRGYDQFYQPGYGPIGLPLDRGRAGQGLVDCGTAYCSYSIEHSIVNRDSTIHGHVSNPRGRTVILIPSGDSTTRSEFEAILNDLITTGSNVIYEVTCSSDQDQNEEEYTETIAATGRTIAIYPDANGRILH